MFGKAWAEKGPESAVEEVPNRHQAAAFQIGAAGLTAERARAGRSAVLWGINTNAMKPKHLLAALFCATLLHSTAQVTIAPLPPHAPRTLAAQLHAALAPHGPSTAPCTVTVMDYAEGRHGSGAALVMGQSPAYWLVLVVQRHDGRGHAERTELHVQGGDAAELLEAVAERMDAWAGRSGPWGTEENAPAQARRDR